MFKNITVSLEELIEVGFSSNGINFLPQNNINSVLSGRHASKLRGRGMDFLELKSYVLGDDLRHIDWKATRRSNKTYVRVYNEERDRVVHIVLSQQSNMFFASRGTFKSVQAAKLASMILHTTLKAGDRVATLIFDDKEVYNFSSSKSKKKSMQILQKISELNIQLLKHEQKSNPKMLNNALDLLLSQVKHDDLIIIIGDGSGLDEESQHKITTLSAHNDVIAAFVYDEMEMNLPKEESLLFKKDSDFLELNAKEKSLQKRYTELTQAKKEHLKELSLLQRIPLLEINTHQELLPQVQIQLGFINRAKQR